MERVAHPPLCTNLDSTICLTNKKGADDKVLLKLRKRSDWNLKVSSVLILTDDPGGADRLARTIGSDAVSCSLNQFSTFPTAPRVIIADIHAPHADTIIRLKRALTIVRGDTTPLLYLIHGSQERGEIQAMMLQATKTLTAAEVSMLLTGTVAALAAVPARSETVTAAERVSTAGAVFASLFRPESPSQELVDHGADVVNRAMQDMKVRDWLVLVARFDDVTHRHCMTVAGLAAAFAAELHFNPSDAHLITKGALLHDIGKSKIPREILNKPGPLTPSERTIMSKHAVFGFEMLKDRDYSEITLKVVRSHHEMLDGSGYPDGLRGDAIPDLVRLVTICDIFAALIDRRPYKAPMPAQAAFEIMCGMTGKLDADLLRAFAPVAFASEVDEAA